MAAMIKDGGAVGKRLLIVEDEENLLTALKYSLEREGFSTSTATDGEQALEAARHGNPDAVILDIMLPKLDGLEVCRILRREIDVPILMLTAKGEEIDRVVGLALGADDYITKPFSMRELVARVRAVLRRSTRPSEARSHRAGEVLRSGDLELNQTSHTVTLRGGPISLKPREFDLLALFVTNRGRAFTRDQILERLWGHDYIGDTRTVDVHVRWLRQKIEHEPGNPTRIITVRGVGYRFDE